MGSFGSLASHVNNHLLTELWPYSDTQHIHLAAMLVMYTIIC